MAICLPVLLTLTLATVDICSAIFIKESVAIAAYEGARTGSVKGGTNAAVVARVKEVLDERGINYNENNVVHIHPKSFESANTLEHVRVRVRVPVANNIISPAELFTSGNLQSFVWMRKEYKN